MPKLTEDGFNVPTERDQEMLDELYLLTVKEYEEELSESESDRYLELWETLKANNIDIPFGVEI